MTKKKGKLILITIIVVLFTEGITNCNGQNPITTNTCAIAKNVYRYTNILNSDSIKYLLSKSDDECNLRLIDSVISCFQKDDDRKPYDILSKIANNSDGYMSDYLVEKITKVYNRKFIPLFNYLYDDHKKEKKNKLEMFLVESWSSITSLSDNPNATLNNIKTKSIKAVSSIKDDDSSKKIQYLNSLLKKINPKYLD